MKKTATNRTFTLQELAEITNSELIGDPKHEITNISSLESATSSELSFLAQPKHQPVRYEQAMRQSQAGAIITAPHVAHDDGRNYLLNPDPSRAFQIVLEAFHDDAELYSGFTEVHPSAVIHESVNLPQNITIGPNAVIDKEVEIGEGCTIGAGSYIGPKSKLGRECVIHPNVTIREQCTLGDRVVIQPGAVIGSCGFGYTQDEMGRHQRLKQLGTVYIANDVEIGANTVIDRARFTSTKVGRGTKIDNLVQVAHGVEIGEDTIIIGQTGIAGSAKIGNHVILAGQVAVNGHIEVCDGVMVAAKSGLSKTVTKPGKYRGIPAIPLEEFNRRSVYLKNIEKYVKMIKDLQTS